MSIQIYNAIIKPDEEKIFLTCHPLRYPQESNQQESILHQKFGLEGLHLHLLEEHILFVFLALKLEKQLENHFHEAASPQSITILSNLLYYMQVMQIRQIYTCTCSRFEESEALNMVSASSSTNTPTGSAPYSLATFEISLATESETERFELGQIIIPMKSAPLQHL
jgi:hypothetical protein